MFVKGILLFLSNLLKKLYIELFKFLFFIYKDVRFY